MNRKKVNLDPLARLLPRVFPLYLLVYRSPALHLGREWVIVPVYRSLCLKVQGSVRWVQALVKEMSKAVRSILLIQS